MVATGCASHLQYDQVAAADDLPRRVELAQTPFHPQTAHHCGPASLAMLLNAAGVAASPDDVADLTYLPGRAGSLAVELLATPRRYQLLGYKVAPELPALLREVAAGRPVLVLQNLGLSWLPRWHFAVLIGYDLDHNQVVLRSGTERRQTMALHTFEHTWQRGDRWAMLVLAPDEVPAVAREVDYLNAALGLEQVGELAEAGKAYTVATELWPNSVSAWMALGNNRYSAGDADGAATAYRRVIALNNAYAPAYNNLAQVMAEAGRLAEAEQLIRQALVHSDGHEKTYRKTLWEIVQRKEAVTRQPVGNCVDECS